MDHETRRKVEVVIDVFACVVRITKAVDMVQRASWPYSSKPHPCSLKGDVGLTVKHMYFKLSPQGKDKKPWTALSLSNSAMSGNLLPSSTDGIHSFIPQL